MLPDDMIISLIFSVKSLIALFWHYSDSRAVDPIIWLPPLKPKKDIKDILDDEIVAIGSGGY